MELKKIKLGSQGLVVPALGLGCMGMTAFGDADIYGPADEQEAIATIHRSLELGGNFLDTADLYGPFINEQLVAKATKGNRDKYTIATKFGWEIDDNNQVTWGINGKKDYVKKAVERSLEHLGTDHILQKIDKECAHMIVITRKNNNHQLLVKFELFLEQYYQDNQSAKSGLLTVQHIAEHLNLSPNYLSDLLRVHTGQNTQQHIHEKLIDKAKEKLSTTDLSVSEIAYTLGFEHPQSFSTLFRKKTNMSPLAFRQAFN